MSHATCMQGNLMMVFHFQWSIIKYGFSFRHNLCFKCPNGSCEPILDIYVSIVFQWYKDFFNPMVFDPYNCPLKIQESIGTITPKMGIHLGVSRVHSFTLFCTLESMRCDSWVSPLGPQPYLPLPWSRAQG
jgi:hypothetical protein